ncbi:MAG: type II secretion system protein GspD [Lentisphaeria bacterium]|nr:type II secretion system protein GspD [Lentisphaeria bacterium]
MLCALCAAAWLAGFPALAQEGGPGGGGEGGPPRFVTGVAPAADGDGGAASLRSKRQAQVELDENTRTLFVTTDAATSEQIRRVLEALDRPVPQALIKVLFLEVTHSDDLDVGLDIRHDHTEEDGDRSILSSLFGMASETRGGIATILQNDLEATLRALAEVGKMRVLSRPSILAANGEEATITIGQEVPFIRNSRITDDGQTINTIEYEDIGIILTVTPQISADGLIEMDVAPEISTITGDTVPITDTVNAPVFAKRSAETHVIVPSGRTVVIGGLMDDQETRTVRKVPLLGDIPLLGMLFRRTITSTSKTELLIFLTPTLVVNDTDLAALSDAEHRQAELIQRDTPPETLRRFANDLPGEQPNASP